MKTSGQKLMKGLVLSAMVWATACSNVHFSPGDPDNVEYSTLPDGTIDETFKFNATDTRAKVDVLFVVDNSTSMLDKEAKLSTRLASFISNMARIDWQIGITTTDISSGPWGIKGSLVSLKNTNNLHYFNAGTPNYAQVFADNVVRDELLNCQDPNCPSGDERPMQAFVNAIAKRNSDNAGFFRSGADVAVVILSDEDEGSDGTGAIQPSAVISSFTSAFGSTKTLTAFGIVVKPGDTACYGNLSSSGSTYANTIAAFVQATGGVLGSICDSDYGQTLESIGDKVRQSVSTITLRMMPNPNTIQLKIVPFDPTLSWTIDGQSLHFNHAPKEGTKIDVLYLPF